MTIEKVEKWKDSSGILHDSEQDALLAELERELATHFDRNYTILADYNSTKACAKFLTKLSGFNPTTLIEEIREMNEKDLRRLQAAKEDRQGH